MEELAKVIGALGSEGSTAFYVYIVAESLQYFAFLGLITWAARSAWPTVKKSIEY